MRVQRLREASKQNLLKTKIKGSDPKTKRKCQKAEKKGIIMKEKLSALQLLFCALIIVGVYGANYQKKN